MRGFWGCRGIHATGDLAFARQRIQRQGGGQVPQRLRSLKGDRAAKAKFESQLDEFLGLHVTAIEGVGNSGPAVPAFGHVPQVFEQTVSRAAHMQDDGQAILAGQFQLLAVEKFLPLPQRAGAKFGHKIIKPNLTHCHQARVIPMQV